MLLSVHWDYDLCCSQRTRHRMGLEESPEHLVEHEDVNSSQWSTSLSGWVGLVLHSSRPGLQEVTWKLTGKEKGLGCNIICKSYFVIVFSCLECKKGAASTAEAQKCCWSFVVPTVWYLGQVKTNTTDDLHLVFVLKSPFELGWYVLVFLFIIFPPLLHSGRKCLLCRQSSVSSVGKSNTWIRACTDLIMGGSIIQDTMHSLLFLCSGPVLCLLYL